MWKVGLLPFSTTDHICWDISSFDEFTPEESLVELADRSTSPIKGYGKFYLLGRSAIAQTWK